MTDSVDSRTLRVQHDVWVAPHNSLMVDVTMTAPSHVDEREEFAKKLRDWARVLMAEVKSRRLKLAETDVRISKKSG